MVEMGTCETVRELGTVCRLFLTKVFRTANG